MQPDAVTLPADFDPDITLCGGQAFRWTAHPDTQGRLVYRGVVADAVVTVTPTAGRWQACIVNHPATPDRRAWLRDYFDLDRDYAASRRILLETFAPLAPLADDIDRLRGLRILRQPWFETLMTFVVSANNHLPRIRQIINVISRKFGQPLGPDDYAFPTPEALAQVAPATLRAECRVGYRAGYITRTAEHVAHRRRFWDQAGRRPTPELRRRLLELPGVGPKVAECTLLFGFHRWEAFPIDIWVRRAMTAILAAPATDRRIAAAAAAHFGPLAGLAQQYLFEMTRRRNYRTRQSE